jgi:hypothetical protein
MKMDKKKRVANQDKTNVTKTEAGWHERIESGAIGDYNRVHGILYMRPWKLRVPEPLAAGGKNLSGQDAFNRAA